MQYLLLAKLSTGWIITIIVLAVIIISMIVLYFLGKKMEKKQAEQQQMMEANKQTVNMLIIDKKRVKLKDAGFPQAVLDQAPKMSRNMKVYVVKAKIGPRIMTLTADEKVYDMIPVRQEIKAMVSGIYILSVKSLRGPALTAPPKLSFFQKIKRKFTGK